MNFVNMYGLIDFDDAGHIKPVYQNGKMVVSLAQAQSNFLYLLAKYNRNFLVKKKEKPTDFFKKDLVEILKDVENGGDYSAALQSVMDNCVWEIKDLSNRTMATEKGLLILLNQTTPLVGTAYDQKKIDGAVNTLEKNYKLNNLAATYENAIDKLIAGYIAGESTLEEKQTIFNALVNLNITYAKLVSNEGATLSQGEHSRRSEVSRIDTAQERAFA